MAFQHFACRRAKDEADFVENLASALPFCRFVLCVLLAFVGLDRTQKKGALSCACSLHVGRCIWLKSKQTLYRAKGLSQSNAHDEWLSVAECEKDPKRACLVFVLLFLR